MTAENDLEKLATTTMPYGKYAGIPLIDLPEPYVVWYHSNGFPEGKLGQLLGLLYEIKLNGLEHLVYSLKAQGKQFL
ncbi:MAG TPA: DUF3820 family protein [Bacteriovoracaceae bacterium]|nr:DUF3820 family protein [Bacteriovoracaceae bacterium]